VFADAANQVVKSRLRHEAALLHSCDVIDGKRRRFVLKALELS
jgi:hypothetical protein